MIPTQGTITTSTTAATIISAIFNPLIPAFCVACGDGGVRLIAVQRAGSKAMAFADFARGARLNAGLRFT